MTKGPYVIKRADDVLSVGGFEAAGRDADEAFEWFFNLGGTLCVPLPV